MVIFKVKRSLNAVLSLHLLHSGYEDSEGQRPVYAVCRSFIAGELGGHTHDMNMLKPLISVLRPMKERRCGKVVRQGAYLLLLFCLPLCLAV